MRAEGKKRNSSIELLKVIAIIMIVFSHSLPNSGETVWGGEKCFIDLSMVTTSVQQLVLVFMKYAGQLGNNIFIVSSAWFLLENSKTDVKKVVHIVADSFVISALATGIFLLCGVSLPMAEIIKSFIPITMNANWFVGCYLIFYLIHPALNVIIQSMDQRKLLLTNLTLGFFYCIVQTLIRDRYYYTQVTGFICIYFFVAYVKKYMKDFCQNRKKHGKYFVCSAAAFTCSIIVLNLLGLRIGSLMYYLTTWSVITNPFLIAMAITLFLIFNNWNFYNAVINYLSGTSLLVYMIHGNRFVQDILKMSVFANICEIGHYTNLLLVCCCMGVVLLVGGFFFASLYKVLAEKTIYRICDFFRSRADDLLEKMVDSMLQWK